MGTVTKGRNRSDRVPERRGIVKGAAGLSPPLSSADLEKWVDPGRGAVLDSRRFAAAFGFQENRVGVSEATTPASGPLWMEITGFPGRDGWRAGFTTRRAGGDLAAVLPLLGWEGLPILKPIQQHGNHVVVIDSAGAVPGTPPQGDGVVTSRRGLVVAIASADCVPLILFDHAHGAGAVLHAGWRGTRSRIAREGVALLSSAFGSRPADLVGLLGPAIGPCCYRVGGEVMAEFRAAGYPEHSLFRRDGDGFLLDLAEANRIDLIEAGVPADHIRPTGLCTRCLPGLFPSYRRDGVRAGRILTFLGSSPEP